MGHATRCIPIIDSLLNQGIEVVLASDGRALNLLKAEYPKLKTYELPGYNVKYSGQNMIWDIGRQLPKISRAVFAEQKETRKIVAKEKIDTIISDNRYGCRSKLCKNIFITHQINIPIPNAILKRLTNKINHHFIRQFDECWVPDFAGEKSLSGNLAKSNMPVRHLGPLSRFKNKATAKVYDLIAVLSGPEPQRSILENKIIEQIKLLDIECLIVQGKTESLQEVQLSKQVRMISFMTSKELNDVILKSEVVLARSGYSTIMDLVALQKKAILIPTPGQTEQEYLAERLSKRKVFYTQSQADFNLDSAMKAVVNYSGFKETYQVAKIDFL